MRRLFRLGCFFIIITERALWVFLMGRAGFSLWVTPLRLQVSVRVYQRVIGVSLWLRPCMMPRAHLFRYILT